MTESTGPDRVGDVTVVDVTPENIADYGVCGYKDLKKHRELQRKIDWFREYYQKGLRMKVLVSREHGYQGMLEYIPGRYAHRPVDADGYMFIHCIFVGFRNELKGKGYASMMLDACIRETREAEMQGVAVVVRNGPFMAKRSLFIRKGFVPVDTAAPDFELLALRFDPDAENPIFRDTTEHLGEYGDGLFVIRSVQCPYTEKNTNAILESARNTFNLKATLIDLPDSDAVQNAPCAFGTFCIVHDGEVISHHPISNTRFENIMKKRVA